MIRRRPPVTRRTCSEPAPEWVSWFVDGRAEHFHPDSPAGQAIAAKLAACQRYATRLSAITRARQCEGGTTPPTPVRAM